MNRRVLVTGGNGFIGNAVLRRLIEIGDIPIITSRNSSDMWRLNDILSSITIYNIDKEPLSNIFEKEKIDAVVNLAAHYRKRDSYEDIDKMIDTNIKFPTLLLELCNEHDVPIFVTAGSYFQRRNNYNSVHDENSPDARDLYAATKNALGRIMEYYTSTHRIRTVELVLFTPYGEMDHDEKLIPYVVRQALRNSPVKLSQGFQRLNLVYVEDVATAFVDALDLSTLDTATKLTIDIANIRSYSIREIVTVIEDLLKIHIKTDWGSFGTDSIDQDNELIIDTSRSLELLKWKPELDIYEGLKRTIEYYKGETVGN
ncbi:MAG: NAD(P)-dependent oxidoreductase [Thermoplasmatales archaeon]